jgi:hypothetical protein
VTAPSLAKSVEEAAEVVLVAAVEALATIVVGLDSKLYLAMAMAINMP